MNRAKTPYVSDRTASAKISETSISAHIEAFKKSGGKIEVLGNTPLHGRTPLASKGSDDAQTPDDSHA